eukprot:TRINITY_DN22586_c0_g1_i1.p1 TRINITY_DN22586_c0_g1~~TRINITY_DN22586_c0_g1_i1.p1  ORF type:complete len:378 (-),score=49.16 TRINITY_DN22586_c0_g1_i1:252-1385(-)
MQQLDAQDRYQVAYVACCIGAAHNIRLLQPHQLLTKSTMVLGADVTHHVLDVSVAGVVASRDQHFASYFVELRGQVPFDMSSNDKVRRRKSEERISDLASMAATLLLRWQHANDALPEVILYYRDGVSNGQFSPVLTFEYNCLVEAFKKVGGQHYNPEVAIIVGQKRHQTRFTKNEEGNASGQSALSGFSGKGYGHEKGKTGEHEKGKKGGKGSASGKASCGKGKPGFEVQVEPGTVAGEGIAEPGHLNFFMVSQKSGLGTAVPCHYHVLHLDPRLSAKVGIDDLERITYDLCHLYSRADKAVGYVSPAYMADHLCERGKEYLESEFGADESECSAMMHLEDEEALKRRILKRVEWLNSKWATGAAKSMLQGRNFFC